MKELEECSFAPQILTKKRKRLGPGKSQSNLGYNASGVIDEHQEMNDDYYDEQQDEEEPRDINRFVQDQNKFLELKRAKEELRRQQLREEEEKRRNAVPKINKQSQIILRQRQERLEQERIKQNLMKGGLESLNMFDKEEEQRYPQTSRLKEPTRILEENDTNMKLPSAVD